VLGDAENFIVGPDQIWDGWVLVILIPLGFVINGSLVIFNKEGQKMAASFEGDAARRMVGLTQAAPGTPASRDGDFCVTKNFFTQAAGVSRFLRCYLGACLNAGQNCEDKLFMVDL
jgi:hypothetical protein